jgi:dipeptidyl aminopeptidase/acylaminoacyl peptidase
MVVAAALLTLLATAQATSTLQTLTPQNLNAEMPPQVSGLRWLDNVHIVGNVKVGKETSQRMWSATGGASSVVALGESRSSPDGTRIVTLENEEWIVREIAAARRVLARVPAAYGKNHLGLILWSRDSRKIALAQVSQAKPEPPDTVSMAETVRYVDVGVQADARDAAGMFTTTITVLDLNEPEAPRRFPFAGRLQALEWGAGDDLYFVTQRFWSTDGAPIETVVRALERGETRDVFRVGGIMQTIDPRVSPDGRWLSVTCDIDSQIWDDFNSLLLVELATGKVRRLTHDKYVSGPSVRWAPDSQRLYYLTRDGGWMQIQSSDLDGRSVALTDSPTLKQQLQVSPDGQRLAYVASDGSARMELRSRATKSNRDTRVALLNDPTTRFRLGRFERVKFPNGEGVQLAAWVIYPPDFDPRKKHPLFVDVHGGGPGSFLYLMGPLSMATAPGPLEWHTWASKGYVVFVPDYRSSGEYGPGIASARHRNGDFGGIEADTRDVEAGIEWISGRPYIDATRIGVLGASAGGARVNLLLTRNTRYRAAAIHDEIGAGVLPEFLNSLIGARTGSLGATAYWQARVGNLAERPKDFLGGFLFDGYKSKTPTLILVGGDRSQEEMAATDPMSAEVLFSILRQSHVPARMLRYLDDGHGFQTPASATHAFEQVDAWFARHLDLSIDANGAIQFEGGRVRPR